MAAPSRSRRGPGTRSGSTSGVNVEIIGMRELRRELRKLENPREWTKRLSKVNRDVAQRVAEWSRGAASSMGGPQGHFAAAIRGRGTVAGGRVAIAKPEAYGAFWGANQRTGWNAGNDTPNLPRWIGNSWDVGVAGQGPYAINETIARRQVQIVGMYVDGVEALVSDAFPD